MYSNYHRTDKKLSKYRIPTLSYNPLNLSISFYYIPVIITLGESKEPCLNKMFFQAGESMKERTHFWVTVMNGERDPRVITCVHHQKITVTVKVRHYFIAL